ncbi:Spt20 family-domain-containing protein [Xylariaceae sp. FL0804]|nr:Spt20 family-domain-containing protein [Xylariaceae sp. FL0804]
MAPVVTAVPPPVPKIKRPPPPGIQTNGASSSQSPSPSISAKKPPPGIARQASVPNSAGVNGVVAPASRPALARARRENGNTGNTRGQRNNASLRSAGLAPESGMPTTFEPRPQVVTDSYILNKYAGNPPSLIVHLHPTHFRFDQQDGIFPYKSPMKVFLDHVRTRTIPHDLLVDFNDAGVAFYEGCLIVQVHDHKSATQSKDTTRPLSKSASTTPASIHNYNPYITPSSYVPHPKENMGSGEHSLGSASKGKAVDGETNDKENIPAPSADGQKSKSPPKDRVFTVVLHPTQHSLQMDLLIKASTPRGSSDAKANIDASAMPPPTPMSAVPPTPTATSMAPPPAKKQKRERMELEGSGIYAAESQILLATTGPLHLEPSKSKEETIALLDRMCDSKHLDPPPKPKTRKRTVAERAADEALAAEQEKYMLSFDERLSSNIGSAQGGADGADGAGQSGAAAFEPRFERFKVIAEIKREHAEKKEQEKARQAENERKLAIQRQQQQQEIQRQQAEQEKLRREQEAAQRAAQLRQQESQRRMAQQAAQQQAAAAAAAQSPPNPQVNHISQSSHGHPSQNGSMPNGLPNGSMPAQATHRFPQGVSQPPVSSPVVRQNTPQNMSSPMVGVAMSTTNSGMGQSPTRPSSVVQNHPPMSAPMAVSMSARGSQQSHPSGTPRMPSATPQMSHGTPINRSIPTPRMSQASPPPGMMVAQNSPMGQHMLMGQQGMGQPIQNQTLAAQVAQQQQQQRRIAHHQQMQAIQNNMMGGPVNPQLQQQLQQQLMRQQMMGMQNMQNPNMMSQQQFAQRYQQQLNNMQQQHQMQGQMQGQMAGQMAGQQMGNQNLMGVNGLSPQQMAMMQQMQAQQQQAQQQAQQQRGQAGPTMNPAIQMHIRTKQAQIYQTHIGGLIAQHQGEQNIPAETLEKFKHACMTKAHEFVQQQMLQQVNRQQQLARQNGMQMGGMMQQGM